MSYPFCNLLFVYNLWRKFIWDNWLWCSKHHDTDIVPTRSALISSSCFSKPDIVSLALTCKVFHCVSATLAPAIDCCFSEFSWSKADRSWPAAHTYTQTHKTTQKSILSVSGVQKAFYGIITLNSILAIYSKSVSWPQEATSPQETFRPDRPLQSNLEERRING